MERQAAEEDAKCALAEWDIDARSVTLEAISENITFKVVAEDSRSYVLRFHRPGYHSLAALNSERAWTRALIESGLDCPVGVLTTKGKDYTPLTICGELRNTGLAEWVDGEVVWRLLNRPEVSPKEVRGWFYKTGEILARLHNHASAWEVPIGFTRHVLDEDGFMGKQPFWGKFWESPELSRSDQTHLATVRKRCFEILKDLSHDSQNFGMIHADLHPGNLIRHQDGLHVIDFDDAGFGWYIYDFAVALLHFRDDENYQRYRDSLFSGYVHHRPLPQNLIPTLDLFYLIRNLAHIGWLVDRPELNTHNQTKQHMAFVNGQGEEILTAYEASV